MIHIREIDHVVLNVADVETMIAFYCDVLGCRIEKRQREFGLTQLRAGTALIDLLERKSDETCEGNRGAVNLDHFCLRIDPFDAELLKTYLEQHGVECGPIEHRYGAEGSGPSIYVSDPEGNIVELKGPPAISVRE